MKPNLNDFTDAQLKAELGNREEARKQTEINRRIKRADFLLQNIDALISLVPACQGRLSILVPTGAL